jgi:hypothetical protein
VERSKELEVSGEEREKARVSNLFSSVKQKKAPA